MNKVTLKRIKKGSYTHAANGFLPEITVTGCNGYWSVSAVEETNYREVPYVRESFSTLKSVKAWIAGFSKDHELDLWESAIKEDAERTYWKNKRADEARLNDDTNFEDERVIEVGKRYKGKFASLNKNCTVGEYKFQCSLPENDEPIWSRNEWVTSKNWYIVSVKITKVVDLSVEEYDNFKMNLMEHYDFMVDATGGTDTDADLPEDWDWLKATDEERELFREKSYTLVCAVRAPGREILLADGSGHTYARYLGFLV